MARKKVSGGVQRDQYGDYHGRGKVVSWSKGKRTVTRTIANKDGSGYTEKISSFNVGGFFGIIACILLLAALFSVFVGNGEPKTFYSFLVMLRDVPEVLSADQIMNFFTLNSWIANLPDWLSWAEGFFNFISSVITIFGFILKGMTDAAMFIFYFVRWLFI